MSKRVLITGAASGIGLACARLFLRSGWQVCGLDRAPRPDGLEPVEWIPCNLEEIQSLENALARLAAEHWDALLLCAGVAGVGEPGRVLRINFFSAIRIVESLAPGMPGHSSVILMSSAAGQKWPDHVASLRSIVDKANQEEALQEAVALCESEAHSYIVSKELLCFYAAYRGLDFRRDKRRINALSPGGVQTPLVADFTKSMGKEAMDFANGLTQRPAHPEEIADVALFLASPESAWINGADIKVDGGLTGGLISGAVRYADWD